MKVAEIAARRGHKVVLLERNRELGGQVNLAGRQPEHAIVGEVTAHLEAQLGEARRRGSARRHRDRGDVARPWRRRDRHRDRI